MVENHPFRNIGFVTTIDRTELFTEASDCKSLEELKRVAEFYSCQCGLRCRTEYYHAESMLENCGDIIP